jgi:hypothetical protein
LHAALYDRVFDADELGKPRFDHVRPLKVSPARWYRARFSNFRGHDAAGPGKCPPG